MERRMSASKLGAWMQCGLKFKYRYVDRIPEQSVWVMHAGTTVHKVLEQSLNQVIRGGGIPALDQMESWFDAAWRNGIKKTESKRNFIGWQDPEESLQTMKKQYRSLIGVARRDVLHDIRPESVEKRIAFDVPTEIGIAPFLGYIDVFQKNGVIIDWKTVTEKVSPNAQKLDIQVMTYSFWHNLIYKEEVTHFKKIFLVRGNDPHVEIKAYIVTKAKRDWFQRQTNEAWRSWDAGIFIANTSGWWCSPKFCSFYGPCQGEL